MGYAVLPCSKEGARGTPLYGIYRYVQPQLERVRFSTVLVIEYNYQLLSAVGSLVACSRLSVVGDGEKERAREK